MLIGSHKIFNDPVYGFVKVPYGILFELVEHPYFQRLRRITQLGLSCYVYPGALHTRFHHALGALHLMMEALEVLRSKGVEITLEEAEAACIAILLHDIGHGPFSHALEHTLLNVHHETLSILLMEELNIQFEGKLSMAICIFKDAYHKKFLHQLVSGQLDMDRMDYLNRDSYFTGVSEGVIGYDRIIKMIAVRNNELVVEQKGIYSIEKFLIARRLMYWQVYLHKTVLSAEQMLIRTLRLAKDLASESKNLPLWGSLRYFFYQHPDLGDLTKAPKEALEHFVKLDDVDIFSALKAFEQADMGELSYLSKCLLERKLFKVEIQNKPFSEDYVNNVKERVQAHLKLHNREIVDHLVIVGKETNRQYNSIKDAIRVLTKDERVLPLSEISDYDLGTQIITKHYLCFPKYS